MAALTSSASSLHRDIRSESRSFKRDKEHSAKWSQGSRPGVGISAARVAAGDYNTVRPEKAFSQMGHQPHKSHANAQNGPSIRNLHKAAGRMYRKHAAIDEISNSPGLSASLLDLLPQQTAISSARTPLVDSGVMYSFDATSSPRKIVGLDSLVEKAELEFKSRETDHILRKEYEVVDESGESTVLSQTKKGKKGSPKQRVCPAVPLVDDDDWERI